MTEIRICHRCKEHTQQHSEVEGQVRKWICNKCRNIAWVGIVPAPAPELPANK